MVSSSNLNYFDFNNKSIEWQSNTITTRCYVAFIEKYNMSLMIYIDSLSNSFLRFKHSLYKSSLFIRRLLEPSVISS